MINWEAIAMGKKVTFETKALKKFVLEFRKQRSSFAEILQNMRVELPVELRNFNEVEGSFETNHGQKIFLLPEKQEIRIQENHVERLYVVQNASRLVSLGSKQI